MPAPRADVPSRCVDPRARTVDARTRPRAARDGAMRRDAAPKVAREDYVVVDLPLELAALPGDALKFEDLDTRAPKLRTIDGARYVGRYEVTTGEQLVVGFDDDDAREARVLAKTERRLKFAPA